LLIVACGVRLVLHRKVCGWGWSGTRRSGPRFEEATQAILTHALFKHGVVAHAMPAPEAVTAYYREHPDEFRMPEQAEVAREPEVEQAVFALAVGEISQPVRTSEGVFLFRLRARYEAHLKPLEMVTISIQAQLAAQNQQRLWKELQGRLWSPDNVIVREDLLKAAIVGARVADSSEQASPKN